MVEVAQRADEIYSLLIPMLDSHILVPNVALAELVPMGHIERPQQKSPDWFLGALDWRGERVPLISFEKANGFDKDCLTQNARVAIFNTLSDNEEIPFIGVVVQGVPRLTHVHKNELETDTEALGKATKARVTYNQLGLDIPDLDYLETLLK